MKLVALLVCTLLAVSSIARTPTLGQQEPSECSIPSDFKIKLQTRNYYVTIVADGKVGFGGSTFDVDIAEVKSRITPEETKALVCSLERMNFFSLRNKYEDKKDGCGRVMIDCGGALISVTMRGKSKHIDHYYGCSDIGGNIFPYSLTALEEQIETLANVKRRR